jgi:peroxiredoxin
MLALLGRRVLGVVWFSERAGAPMSRIIASSDSQHRLAEALVGLELPPIVLEGYEDGELRLREYSVALPVVLYLYPGSPSSPEEDPVESMDGAQHRAFRDHRPDLEARGYRAIGISSESLSVQRLSGLRNRLPHRLLSDPRLELAQELGLPTFAVAGRSWYERLTLVASGGRIEKAFFPVASAARSAAQVIAWMTMHGVG